MTFTKKIAILAFITLSINALYGQMSVVLSSDVKKTEADAGDAFVSPSSTSSYRSIPFYSVKTFDESDNKPNLTISNNKPTYTDLNKLAADSKSNYLHSATNTLFPYSIDDFQRQQIVVSKEDHSRISVIYDGTEKNKRTSFTVTLIPSGEAKEGRLRNEFGNELSKLLVKDEKSTLPHTAPIKFNGRKYTCNGIESMLLNSKSTSELSVYECGSWLLFIKIQSSRADSVEISKLSATLTQYINPARLTAVKPLNLKPNVDFDREALKDTITIGALFGNASKKLNWASENVNMKELYSGFPDIYLTMHIESWKEYLKILGKKKNLYKNTAAKQFYDDLLAVNNSGYLAEFIMEQYDRIMLVPTGMKLDFDGFSQWKQTRPININLREKRYTICYRNLPY